MADGTVVIKTDLDNKQAQTKLNDLKTQIARLGKEQAKAEKDIAAAEQNRAKINNELITQQQKLIELQERATREEQSLNALVEQRDSAQTRRDAARRETEIARQTWAREAQRAGDNYATDVGAQQAAARLNAMREQERAISAEYDKINQKMWEQSGALDRINQDLQQQTAIVNNLGQELTQADNAVQNSKDAYSGITQRLEQAQADAGRYTQQIATTNETIDKTKQKLNEVGDTGEKAARRVSKGFGGIGEGVKRLGHRIVGLAKRVFVFSMITMALRNVRKWLMNVVNSNDEASQSLARLKGSFLTLAQPLLNSLVPALTKVLNVINRIVGAIASFIAAIFGTTVEQAQASAEAMNNEEDAISGVGGAAKKASKQLANFDEINKLGEDSAGGGGGGGTSGMKPIFDMDTSLFGKIKQFMDDSGITSALEDVGAAIAKLKDGLETFWNSPAGQTIKLILKDTFITALKLLADVLSILAAVLSGDLWSALDSLQKLSWDIIFGVLKIFANIIDLIFNPEGTFGVSATDAVTKAEEFISKLPKVSEMAKKAKDTLSTVFEPFTKKVKAIYYLLQSEWYYVKWWYIRNVKEKLEAIWQPIQDAWDTLIKWLRGDGMTDAEETGASLGEAFANSLRQAFVAIAIMINGIIGSIETALNMLISKINTLSIDVPNKPIYGVFAGEHLGFNLPPVSIPRITIPGLAEGAVIPPNREFLAVLGDQKSGTNIEAPLETIVEAVRQALGGGRTVVLELDRRELGRAVVDVYGQETRRTGLRLGGAY